MENRIPNKKKTKEKEKAKNVKEWWFRDVDLDRRCTDSYNDDDDDDDGYVAKIERTR